MRSGKVKGERQSTTVNAPPLTLHQSIVIQTLHYTPCSCCCCHPPLLARLRSVSPGSPVPQAKLVQLVAVHAMFHRHPQQTDKRRGGEREGEDGEAPQGGSFDAKLAHHRSTVSGGRNRLPALKEIARRGAVVVDCCVCV